MELARLTWPEVDALDRDMPVIIPVAALEQHGHHMPVFTDSMLLGEIVRRAHESLEDRALLVPLMWLGNSHHHLDFPGTVSAEPRVWLDMLSGLVDSRQLYHAWISPHRGDQRTWWQRCPRATGDL